MISFPHDGRELWNRENVVPQRLSWNGPSFVVPSDQPEIAVPGVQLTPVSTLFLMPFLNSVRGRAGICCVLSGLALVASSCAQQEPSDSPTAGWKTEVVAQGVPRPWGMAWLPDGTLVVTAKEGSLHKVVGSTFEQIPAEGFPEIFSGGQGGLMDVSLHPNFARNRQLYFTASTGTGRANRTTLLRGVYDGKSVRSIETLYQVSPDKSGGAHFGSRLLWLPDGTLLMSIGDGGNPPQRIDDRLAREQAQNPGTPHGSLLRLTEDGKPAAKNPSIAGENALPELWSLGHRNIQGLTRDAGSGRIWATEHGPRGGDELNLVEAGKNYGWPLVTLGRDYRTGLSIGDDQREGFVDPRVVWTPAHAPSGLAFYTGSLFPSWKGSLFSGGLAGQEVRRISLDGEGNVTGQERLAIGRRVRDVRQGPDGHLYLLTDEQDGQLLRIVPQKQ